MKELKTFVLLGDGKIAERHKQAIDFVGGKITHVYDPFKYNQTVDELREHLSVAEYAVILSPSYLHAMQTKLARSHNCKVIVEKPHHLPWQPYENDDLIFVCLPFRYVKLPDAKPDDCVKVSFLRDADYWKGWQGDFFKSGGVLSNLFIHYIDIAIRMGVPFNGQVSENEGINSRMYSNIDLSLIDMNNLYRRMYDSITDGFDLFTILPKDLYYLDWIINKYTNANYYIKLSLWDWVNIS